MPEVDIALTVNGRAVKWHVEAGETLLEALHAHHLKGTKLICGTGDCCGCCVLLNGNSINACCMLAAQAEG
ncbi:MAG TPA: (2Fe-2S)-binding protein, partial [Ktedonobacter sp.]|nr:(2Fe-2S)-binding protein [Ktedonobacter sp.]